MRKTYLQMYPFIQQTSQMFVVCLLLFGYWDTAVNGNPYPHGDYILVGRGDKK